MLQLVIVGDNIGERHGKVLYKPVIVNKNTREIQMYFKKEELALLPFSLLCTTPKVLKDIMESHLTLLGPAT